jgi:hypothetical protein
MSAVAAEAQPPAGSATPAAVAGEFEFTRAGPADEPEIRRLVGSVAMPGAISVRFEREPDYFLGTTIMGDPCDVLIARRRADGRLAGVLCRGERRAFINGEERPVGYIGQIRVAPEFRGMGGRLMARGLPLFREMGAPDLLYEGVVASDNPRARALLLELRPPGGLHATRISGLTSFAFLLRPRRPVRMAGLSVDGVTPSDLEAVVAFLRRGGARRQLFPAYRLEDFTDGRTMRGLEPEDLAVARRGDRIVGVMGTWDQSAFKQEIVGGYGPALGRLRPAYDVAARLLRARRLPRVGERIEVAFAAPVCIADDDPGVFRTLLARTLGRARTRGLAFVMAGFADADPLLAEARRTLHVTYRSDLFVLSWTSPAPAAGLDGRVPYCEIATL